MFGNKKLKLMCGYEKWNWIFDHDVLRCSVIENEIGCLATEHRIGCLATEC